MVTTYDHHTSELRRRRIRLNDELIFSPQQYKTGVFYHIEIPSSSRFFRIGYREFVFVSLLDGKTSFAHALAIASQQLGVDAISEEQAKQTMNWLLENGLAQFSEDVTLNANQATNDNTSSLQKLNPFWLKIPLGEPNDLLQRLGPYVGWLFHPLSVVCSALLVLFATLTLVTNWNAFMASSGNIFSASNWIWMLASWIFLKIAHELAHGIVCNRFGGKVKQTGIIFILFAPMAYVDVTSSWRFSSRWRRIAVSAAGMYIELVIASICVIAWCFVTSQLVAHQLFNIIFIAGFSTLLFNANPLMRFDGYFILSDLLKIPNLYQVGTKSFQGQMRRLFFGEVVEKSRCELSHNGPFVLCYGICVAIWKVVICIGLSIAASVMFGGLGILLAAFGIASWFGQPALKLIRELIQRRNSRPISVVRASIVTGVLGLACVASWCFIPNPFSSRNPCVVDFKELSKIRASSPGFVKEVFVEDGQPVKVGEPLLRLENLELDAEVAKLKAQLNLAQTHARIAVDNQKPTQVQIEKRNQKVTRDKLAEIEVRSNELLVKAKTDGRVVAKDLRRMIGTYVNEGDVLLAVADEDSKEIILSLSSEDVRATSDLIGHSIPIEIGSRRRILGMISRVDPKASLQLANPSLAATNGGSLVVKPSDQAHGSKSDRDNQFELCEPRFHVIAEIDAETSRGLFSGERGFAVLNSKSTTLGPFIYNSIRDWLHQQLAQARSGTL